MKLDYSITSPEERNELVKQILAENPEPNEKYLEALADYLVLCMEKQEKREKKILTENRLATVNKRETSYEGLIEQLENGEDGIYNLMGDNSRNTIFQPKITITKKDLEEIPPLRDLRESIKRWEEKLKTAEGRDAFIIKKALIDMRKDQYIIKEAFRKPIKLSKTTHVKFPIHLDDSFSFNENGFVIPEGISLCNPKICSIILCNYSKLREDGWGDFEGDLWALMEDFDQVSNAALAKYPLYEEIVIDKIDGLTNLEIQQALEFKFGVRHSLEYISSLWRNKIPLLIASAAEDRLLDWYYLNEAKGRYKRCSRCGKIKLAHNKYFSKNKTSKDGFYSICKECRNTKGKKV